MSQFFERLETQLKQVLREAELREGRPPRLDVNIAANLMLSTAEGKISQFVRSDFSRLPSADWSVQWETLSQAVFGDSFHGNAG
jgi:TetR/AcrR family transcriptional regulator